MAAAQHEVRSVLLVSRRPPREIRSVALDRNSRTSAALVEIVLRDRYGCSPDLVAAAGPLDGRSRLGLLDGGDASTEETMPAAE